MELDLLHLFLTSPFFLALVHIFLALNIFPFRGMNLKLSCFCCAPFSSNSPLMSMCYLGVKLMLDLPYSLTFGQNVNYSSSAGVVWFVLGLCPTFLIPLYPCWGELGSCFPTFGRLLDLDFCLVGGELCINRFLSSPWWLPWIISVL